MPLTPHPIYGYVKDHNGNVIAGATVYLIDTTTQEQLSATKYATTNSAGEYELNMVDLTTYTLGDGIDVTASKSGYITATKYATTSGAGTSVDIFMDTIKVNVLSTNRTTREVARDIALTGVLARANRAVRVWVNNLAASGSAQVLVASGGGIGKGYTSSGKPVINLAAGEVCYIDQMTCMVRTAAKTCSFEIVKCTAADGAGTATSLIGQIYEANGTLVEAKPFTIRFSQPIKVSRNYDGALSVGIKITGTDSSTYIDCMLEGMVLEE